MPRKPEDIPSSEIEFGVELETMIPNNCEVAVGTYHGNTYVTNGLEAAAAGVRQRLSAPQFGGKKWRADRDGSIQPEPNFQSCEFVSPILKGEAGVTALRDFVRFAKAIGGKVNRSCGCHVTVGIKSVIGTVDDAKVAMFVRKLTRVVKRHTWAIYAQTGTDRHNSGYCFALPKHAGVATNTMLRERDIQKKRQLAGSCMRGLLNLNKVFPDNMAQSAVEFRAFAGTLNENKVLHHVATCLGIMRRAATARHIPRFDASVKPDSALDALHRLWAYLGWVPESPGTDVTFGQFGLLHRDFENYSKTAEAKARLFEQKYPKANL